MDAIEAPTVRTLLGRSDLSLRLESAEDDLDAGALDRPLRWVHSSDLADPAPFLSEGLVLLTTGTQFATADPADDDEYVRRLAARGVLGLGFGTEVVRDGVPGGLVEACRAHRMPLFEVPYRTPFIAVARAAAEAIAAQAYARRSWALSAQRAIALAALRPDGLGATLAELARQLGAWVGLFDAAGGLSREHPSGGLDEPTIAQLHREVDTVLRRGSRAGWAIRIGDLPFTLQTLGRGGHLRGVVAISAGDLDQEGRSVLTSVIAMAGLAFEQQEGVARARGALRTGLVRALLAGRSSLADDVSRELWGPLPAEPVAVALTDAAALGVDAIAEQLELHVDEHPGSLFFGAVEDGVLLVVGAGDDRQPEGRLLEHIAERFGLRIGLSDAHRYGALATAADQARLARDAGASGVGRFADIARRGMLAALATDQAHTLARAELEPLHRHDAAHGTELVRTLRIWLDGDGSNEACARALGVHRHTVRARIALVERVLGRDLASFAARAELWAALRAAS